MVYASGKLVEYLIDTYMYPDVSKGMVDSHARSNRTDVLKGASFKDQMDVRGNFLSEDQVLEQYHLLEPLTPENLKKAGFFGKKRSHFIQVANKDH
jgi:hypothetical protein